jgi:TonB-dependent receptor
MTQTNQNRLPNWQKFIVLACFWLAAALTAQAQTTGSIQGRVFNPVTKEYVNNAEIKLEGTNQVTYSESDGSFRFENVPAGQASVSVSFTGYNTVKESFTVTAGQPAVREINISSSVAPAAPVVKDGVVQLQAFSVSSTREGNSKAIQAQRRDMNIITSVSSDVFGDVTDGNVGEFLKYLPGVDLDYVESEPRGPRLGGMDGQYTGVAFDGIRTASADANRGGGSASRATSFEGFAITSVDSVEINRTASPENDADSPAGTVNMKSKRAFDRKGRTFNYNYGINMNGEEFTLRKTPGIQDSRENVMAYKWAPNWQAGYAESFFNQRFGILLSASHANSYTEQNSETVDYNRGSATDARPLVVRDINFGDGPKFIIKDALLLTADWKVTPRLTLSLNASYSYFEGHFWNRNFEWVVANSNANVNNGRNSVLGDGVNTVIAPRDLTQPTGVLANGTIANNGIGEVRNGGGSSSKLSYNRQYAPRFEYKIGSWVIDGSIAMSFAKNNYESLERGFSNAEDGRIASGFTATRPNNQSWEWAIKQNSGPDWSDLRNWTFTSDNRAGGTRVTNDNRTWITEKWTGALNATWSIPFMEKFPTKMKVGAKWDEETRKNRTDSDMDIWSYIGPGGNTVTYNSTIGAYQNTAYGTWANVGPQFVSPFPWDSGTTTSLKVTSLNGTSGIPPRVSRSEVANLFHAHPELFVNTMTPENYYTDNYVNARHFRQTMDAGYWQADTRLTSKIQIRVGVRAEQTNNAFLERDPLTRAQLLAKGVALNGVGTNAGRPLTIPGMITMFETNPMITRRSSYTDWFPSIVAKYNILPNLEWQAGANKAISRPGIDNLTGLWVQNDNANPPTVTAPNATLQPEHHKVYQTRIAYYFGSRSPGQLSVAYIQDEAMNFIVSRNYTADQFGVSDPDFSNYTFISTTNFEGLQRTKNLDLNYNQTLGFLPSEYLRGVSVAAGYSRSYVNLPPNVRRNNLAPHRATARLGYNYKRFNASVGGIWIDDRPIDGVYGRVWGAMTKLDISATWKLNRWASIYMQCRNPTNQKDLRYESPPGVTEGKQKYLRAMEAYGDNWVFGVKGQF